MSFRRSRCPKHPSQVVVGVCSLCLRERLAVLVNAEGLGETDSSWPSRHSVAIELIRNGNGGIHAVGDRVFSARNPFNIEIEGIKSNSVSVRRSAALHDARNAWTNKSDHAFSDSRASDVASIQGIEKKTLSSLFNTDDANNPTTKARIASHSDRKANVTITNGIKGGSCRSFYNNLQSESREHGQDKSRRGSFLERAETGNSLLSMPEDDRRFSWFSTLFRRRKKSRRKSIDAFTTVGEHNEWVDARRSWDAPRLSPWEKLGSSYWEIHRSSWEPARPSWEGQSAEGELMFSAIDILDESLSEVRQDTEPECAGLQDFMSYMAGEWGNNSVTERGPREGRKFDEENASRTKQVLKKSEGNASETKQVLLETPPSDGKESARTFLSAKALQMQRDVSTQTSPPRAASGVTNQKVFGQLSLPQHHQPNHHHEQPRAPAAWSKVLSKTRWALKHKHKDGSKEQEAMNIGEADYQASTVSGSSSFHEFVRESTTHRPYQVQPGLNKEYGAWNAYCSPMQKSDLNAQQLQQQQHKKCFKKGESVGDRSKNFGFPPFNLENGLLRFYLTPVRSTLGSRTKSKPKGYCPWV